MDDLREARRWLKLGYETHGPAGVLASANAMGLSATEFGRAVDGDRSLLTIDISGKPHADGLPGQLPIQRGPPRRVPIEAPKPPTECPKVPPRGMPGWRSYSTTGDPYWFHCGFEGYLEDRDPSPDAPVAECFYDEQGQLVDGNHPYAGCKGTPDSYGAHDLRHLLWLDPGGIWQNFGSVGESVRYRTEKTREWLKERGYAVPPPAPSRAPYPY